MTRSELLAAAQKQIGRSIHLHQLDHAVSRGYVKPESRRPDGWNVYGDDALEGLVAFMRERSRSIQSASV
ncbi:hypothetical protein LOC71_00890 [Rhodopirellula sp. JC740]|uniref:HTH merR-type domain-containing protein n=1 Tax=Rhodopirellula halodulae TaxID=2894198 RepID=A0ABS8NB84_9BACT|nr:hypothetical protein [Rhodopirellula sp. JC740]MCC9640814.1 hypothetical protein [Rhodopirellula sp. JC740]